MHWPVAPAEAAPDAGPDPAGAEPPRGEPLPVDRAAIIEWLREEAGLVRDDSDEDTLAGPPFDVHEN